jgi:putative MATE family efflux protein
MKPSKSRINLTDGPVSKSIVSLMLPIMIGMVALMSYSLADTYFVAQIGTLELAAMSFTFPVNFIVGAIAMGIGTGVSSIVSRLFGKDEMGAVQRIATHAMLLAAILGIGVTILGLTTIYPLFTLLGADETTLPLIERYMSIYYYGGMFLVIPMIGNSVMRASGDAKTPAKIMSTAAVLNVILDPILIFGWDIFGIPALGLEGAAIATVMANVGTALASVGIIVFRDRLIRLKTEDLKLLWQSWTEIMHIGIPSMTSSLIAPMTTAFITWQVSAFGQESVAGFGVASRVEGLAMLCLMALSASIAPFTGQNYGRGNYERVKDGIRFAYRFALVYGLVIAVLMFGLSPYIAAAFTDDPIATEATVMHMRMVPWSYLGLGAGMISVSAFNAIGKPMPAMWISLTRTILVYAPMAFLLAWWIGLFGVFLAAFIANLSSGSLGFIWFRAVFFNWKPGPEPAKA